MNRITLLAIATSMTLMTQAQTYSWKNLPKVTLPIFKKDTLNITKFGAIPDGMTLNTESINKAIEACSKQGGGVVMIPQGIWLTGPVVLKSNVNLYVSRSAVLQFTGDKSQYPLIESHFEGKKTVRNQAPISGTDLENVAITGDGVIDGNGDVWRMVKRDKVTEGEWKKFVASGGVVTPDGRSWYPSESYMKAEYEKGPKTDYTAIKDYLRPNMVVLRNCKKVLLQNATFQNSPCWNLHTLYCEHVTFDGVRVRNQPSAQNGDGMDIESCSYVEVKNSTLDCGDDGICIKSGKDEEGRKVGKASQFIYVHHNIVYKAHGGFTIGSEMSGGAHDIFVTDCSFIGTDVGLRFKTQRGRGGIVENIYIKNINMRNIVNDAISFDMYYFGKPVSLAAGKVEIPPVNEGTPQFRKFYISNIVCDGASRAMIIRGLPEMSIKDISLSDVVIKSRRGADLIEASNVSLSNVALQCTETSPLINIENSQGLSFVKVRSLNTPTQFYSVNGDRSKEIKVDIVAEGSVQFGYGAEKSAVVAGK
ncbi:glycoside hydrolase [Niastella yeongjuensis]|uniref:Glycoside hydrolase n=1 Tax=Niastella yeongjuensis TaxID=354355 RepID=A0A1V9EJG1_9BACT|nr:glycoside hydrolase family 28 protein [Niastella yeongjuensis]OQP46025.1 glycoside hydrolase [Niastella yeongjuensis]SEP18770.1 Pectate lyase superfamily protein [Niastella yeongjuensis]